MSTLYVTRHQTFSVPLNSSPRPFFQDDPGASASVLLDSSGPSILLEILPFASQILILKFGQIFTLVFYLTGSSTKKRKHRANTDYDSKPTFLLEPTFSSDSDSSSTVDTSSSKGEGEDEKHFILQDYCTFLPRAVP